jgi:hypothetical protein
MIRPSKEIVIGGGAAAAVAVGAIAFARRGSAAQIAGAAAGLVGLGLAVRAWFAEDREITRNPDVMNGHFLTEGALSAMTGGLADAEHLRRVMVAPRRRTMRKGVRRADRLRS